MKIVVEIEIKKVHTRAGKNRWKVHNQIESCEATIE